MPRKKKDPKPFLSGYKKYDPKKEGYGDPSQWQEVFSRRMGLEQANSVLQNQDPYDILEVARTAGWEEIQKAHRKQAMLHHTDRGGDPEKFKLAQAAYEVLEERYKKC